VVLFEPYYGYHRNTLEALGAVPVYVPLAEGDFALDLRAFERALSLRTRALVLNTPGNPSGKVFARDELAALGEIACARDLWLLTDEVYEHFVFDARRHLSPASLPGLRERTITMNALSKTFAITGWRIGWVAAPRALAEVFAHLHDLVYVCAPAPLQPSARVQEIAGKLAADSGARLLVTADILAAVAGADFLYTDAWLSMGESATAWGDRIHLLMPYQVNQDMMAATGNPGVKFMHCLPALHNRDTETARRLYNTRRLTALEVTEEVFESPASIVFDQADNRLHTIKAVMVATAGDLR